MSLTGVTIFKQEKTIVFIKASIALALIVVVSSGALAAPKRQQDTGAAVHAVDQRRQAARQAHGSAPPTDICRQTGTVTMPATNPDCNRQGWLENY
jgi:hypothetical protein